VGGVGRWPDTARDAFAGVYRVFNGGGILKHTWEEVITGKMREDNAGEQYM